MANFDDIFTGAGIKQNSGYVPREEWIARKRAERQAVYDRVEEYLQDIKESAAHLQTYLDVQGRMGAYSVSNAILIAAQKPTATKLADFAKWQEQGVSVNKGECAIDILEPGQEYTKRDGTAAVSYNVKKLFDISQTNAEEKPQPPSYDGRMLLGALISHAPCEIKLEDNLPDNVNAKYEADTKQIAVRQGLSAVDIFRSLTQEIGRAYLAEGDYKTLNPAFSVYCVSYMLCKRFNVAVDGIGFNRLPDEYGWVDTSEIKVDLATMREVAKEITTDINLGLAEQEKKVKAQAKDNAAR